ncbi:MAG TPA: NADH-quinone oxidoreductase subunit L, partial [Candidatus Acidoferrum sp.]|nr:NADH-quinone oxidoreductase subunit L [Candidatus Acidoferrum sp.]
TLHAGHGEVFRAVHNFDWLTFGNTTLKLGWMLDPLTAVMLLMVTFVSLLIFIYSIGYMAHDENFTRFFCFLALFAAAMLGIIIANSLLLLFMSWELVGLASYLLIGFWYQKPSAAAAAKKAFITTRVGDIGFLLGMLWLYSNTGTLLFYDNGNGCLEQSALTKLVTTVTAGGMVVSTAVALLIFCGAIGKSGQVPLHVWLPDAMEGPTPVSALIHAATMVAAGVFLVARVYPLMDADPMNVAGHSPALTVVTWIGAITAVFAALIAVAQNDIKRILAYSTVSQLGYMMMGLGVGGVAVGMFHLLTHAFFKALLFLGSGSVIHGMHEEQDIRRMGALRHAMPITFLTYAIGMMALCGVPLFFSGFWSKDEILHAASGWSVSKVPFYMGLFGAVLTAFYMTRQVYYVFFGADRRRSRGNETHASHGKSESPHVDSYEVHESPAVMTIPLVILAVAAIVVGFFGTPAWPWLHSYLTGHELHLDFGKFGGAVGTMILSTIVVAIGIGSAWLLYSRKAPKTANEPDPLEAAQPSLWRLLANRFYIDELYEATVVRLNAFAAVLSDWLDRVIWNGLVEVVKLLADGFARISRAIDQNIVNGGFDESCGGVKRSAGLFSRFQNGRVQSYLRVVGAAMVILVLLLLWGCRS